MSSLPQISGPFILRRQIATGASSTVFEAENTTSKQSVALKVFHTSLLNDSATSARLQREAQALKAVRHPNVVELIESWTTPDGFFLELELVRGRTLREWREQSPGEWIEPKLWILAQVARALGAVHEQQILHRDLKPDNILVADDGMVKLTDFGLARSDLFNQQLTQTGSLVGSLAYMAPETIEGQKASFASDIFSFGVIAFELLCNRHPFHDEQGHLQLQSLLGVKYSNCSFKNPRIPADIGAWIDRCLSARESDRPSSIWLLEAAFMDHLQRQGLLNYAKGWVAGDESILPQALAQKNRRLKVDIEKAMTAGDRKSLLALVNELHALFPNDLALPTLMRALSQPTPQGRGPTGMSTIVTVILILLLSAFSGWKMVQPVEVPVTPVISASPAISIASVNPGRAEINPPAPKPLAKLGTLRVLADPDVRVFVNGSGVNPKELENYRIKSGRHTLRMEKNGFDPIEQKIVVRSGRTTTINARAGEK